ncbi:MAG: antibiotic biosynthesis monooxygenase [Acidobacteria bacterium]|nr:antibiotic biosynthesis monooxygenase [Acidobacteriota bacterium]MBI3661834.1 antibiotic biosynthesis monooxygenase [Acidobacteriota bacterium]
MMARIWRGVTPKAKAAEYVEYLKKTGVRDYRSTVGNLGVLILLRPENEHTEFVVLSLWESWDALRSFAGDDVEAAKYYPEDAQFLLHLEPNVTHHEVTVGIADKALEFAADLPGELGVACPALTKTAQ